MKIEIGSVWQNKINGIRYEVKGITQTRITLKNLDSKLGAIAGTDIEISLVTFEMFFKPIEVR